MAQAGQVAVFFTVQVPELLPDELQRPQFNQTVHVVGEGPELGSWDPEKALPLTCTGEAWMSPAIFLPAGARRSYRYVLKRSKFIVDWEALEPSRSLQLPSPPSSLLSKSPPSLFPDSPDSAWNFVVPCVTYGEPEQGLPSSRPPAKSLRNSQWLTPSLGSEVRLAFGTCKLQGDPIKMDQPGQHSYTMRMKWGSTFVDSITTSGRHITSRLRKSLLAKEAGHEGAEWATFKFNAQIGALQAASPGEATLLLEVLEGKTVVAEGFIPITQFVRPNYRQGSTVARISRGSFTVPLSYEKKIVGEAVGDFLISDPFVHPNNNLEHVWSQYWAGETANRTMLVGHRGMGRSYRAKGGELQAIRENTILSFATAGSFGAELVELDVMLTADRIPIVFHDFQIGIKGQKLSSAGSPRESIAIPVSQLTLAQLKSLVTTGVSSDEFLEKPSDSTSEEALAQRASLQLNVPTLEELFKNLPESLGLNIEIKYPVNLKNEWLSFTALFEINAYLNAILEVVFAHAGKRRVVFSSFSPDICIALNLKQPRYPVCFLTEGGNYADTYTDARSSSLGAAFAFAQSNVLSGVVTDSEPLFKDSDFKDTQDVTQMVGKHFVQECRNANLMLWTWGNANSDPKKVELQREWGCGAVICDNIDKLTNKTPTTPTTTTTTIAESKQRAGNRALDLLVYASFSLVCVAAVVIAH